MTIPTSLGLEKIKFRTDFDERNFMECYTNVSKDLELLLCIPQNIKDLNFETYQTEHVTYVKKRFEKKRRILLGYDMRMSQNECLDFVKKLGDMHESLDREYQTILKCTFIVVENEILANLVNVAFKMFRTTTPVKICKNVQEVVDFCKHPNFDL